MSSLVPKEPPSKLDHDAHLLRLSLEIGQIATIIVTIVAFARSGMSLASVGALVAAVLLTIALVRTPRPPLPRNGDSEDDR
jgi:hypothetical protein